MRTEIKQDVTGGWRKLHDEEHCNVCWFIFIHHGLDTLVITHSAANETINHSGRGHSSFHRTEDVCLLSCDVR